MIVSACLLIGVGVGMVLGETPAFTLIGLGIGMLIEYFNERKISN